MIKKTIPFLTALIISVQALAQAGNGVYAFLDLPVSSRIAALGGTNVSLRDNDLNFAFCNPALLTAETHNTLSLSMANYLADIKFGSAAYGRTYKNNHFLGLGVQYIDYGTFEETTDKNEFTGQTFTAKDMALNIMYAHPLTNNISVGATLKPIHSVYERYTSSGVALDAGVHYNGSSKLFSAGLVLRNMGTQLTAFYRDEEGQHYEALPLNILLGASLKLKHAPLRFSTTWHNLQSWKLNYQTTNMVNSSPLLPDASVQEDPSKIKFVDMAFRHSIWAVEFVPTKNFYISASYNHRRHQELKVNGFKSMAGFSFGAGLKLYKFHVGFATTNFLAGHSAYQFSISTALNDFRM